MNDEVEWRISFHVVGRDTSTMPSLWRSKIDQQDAYDRISDPEAHTKKFYPEAFAGKQGVDWVKLCFSCDKKKLQFKQ
jgi:hypothetical protein